MMKTKRTLPPTKAGRRPRHNYEESQKKVREAIDAAFKKKRRRSEMTDLGRRAHSAEKRPQ
jgi:hypothetical protein